VLAQKLVASAKPGWQQRISVALFKQRRYCFLRVGCTVRAGHWAAFEKVDHLQHKMGAVVLLALLGAMGLGLYLFSGAA